MLFSKNDLGFMPALHRQGLGIQYYGSKEILCPDLFVEFKKHLPHARALFDLFGGGGSVSWHGLASNLEYVHYNELKKSLYQMYKYVFDCIVNPKNDFGIFDKEVYMWHERDFIVECQKQADTSGMHALLGYIWSFSCCGVGYAYGDTQCNRMKREVFKITMCPFVYSKKEATQSVQILCDYFTKDYPTYREWVESILMEFIENPYFLKMDWIARRKAQTSFILPLEALRISGLFEYYKGMDLATFARQRNKDLCNLIDIHRPDLVASAKVFKRGLKTPRHRELTHYKNIHQVQILERLERLQRLERLERLESLQRLESLDSLERLERLERLAQYKNDIHKVTLSNLSYLDFDFANISKELDLKPNEIIIYCDIPYQDKKSKQTYKSVYHNDFDLKKFYDWCISQANNGFTIFLSEYNPPEAFLDNNGLNKDFVFNEIFAKQKQTYSKFNDSDSEGMDLDYGQNVLQGTRTALEKLFILQKKINKNT